jgi:2-methylcitrate dehydratase
VALGCVHGVFLAFHGVTGPRYVIEGSDGLAQAVGQPIHIDWDNEKLDCFDRLALKSYNTAVPGQSSIFCILELRKAHAIDPSRVDSIEDAVFRDAYDFMGGGSFGPKTDVHTKEDADHSLPYLLAVAVLDGDVQPAQLEPRRIEAPDVQSLLQKVTVRPDAGFTARYPGDVPSRVTVRLNDGKSYSHEVKNYPGFPTWPFTWDEIVAKFDKLLAGRASDALATEIKAAVRSLETIQVKDLTKLLGDVKADRRG